MNRPKVTEIKNHSFFKKINWLAIEKKKVEPPIKPSFSSEEDTKYFPSVYIYLFIQKIMFFL